MATEEAAMFCAQICKSGLEFGAKLSSTEAASCQFFIYTFNVKKKLVIFKRSQARKPNFFGTYVQGV